MARPRVDTRLQNIEDGIDEIMNKLCEMSPCAPNKDEPKEEESEK